MINSISHFLEIMGDIAINFKNKESDFLPNPIVSTLGSNTLDAHLVSSEEMNNLISCIQQFIVKHSKEVRILNKESTKIIREGISALKNQCINLCNPESCKSINNLSTLFKKTIKNETIALASLTSHVSVDPLLKGRASSDAYINAIAVGLDTNTPLIFSKDPLCNPWLILVQSRRGDLIEKLSLSPYSPDELFDYCFERILKNRDLKGAHLLSRAKALVEKSETFRTIQFYNSNFAIYYYLVTQIGKIEIQKISQEGYNLLHFYLYNDCMAKKFVDFREMGLEILGISSAQMQMWESILECARIMQLNPVCEYFLKLLGRDPENNPLHDAIIFGDEENIKEISKNSKLFLSQKNAAQQTPFDLLVKTNQFKLLPLIAPFCNFTSNLVINSFNIGTFANYPFLISLENHNYEMAKALWDLGCVESPEMIEELLGKDPEIRSHFSSIINRQPEAQRLYTACIKNNLPEVKEILESKPWLFEIMFKRKMAFALAVMYKSQEVITFLHAQKISIYGILEYCSWSDDFANIPLYLVIKNRLTNTLNLFLDNLPDLPSLKELLKEDEISIDLQNNYLYLTRILDRLIKDKDLDSILLLATHPKTEEFVLREGLVRAVNGNWDDAKVFKILLKKGFDINGIHKLSKTKLETPLLASIYQSNTELTNFFICQGADLEPSSPSLSKFLATPFMIAYQEYNMEMILFLIDAYQQKQLEIPWDLLLHAVQKFPEDNRLLLYLLRVKNKLSLEENKNIANKLLHLVFEFNLDIEGSIFGLFNYGVTYLKTEKEWEQLIEETGHFAQVLSLKFPKFQNDKDLYPTALNKPESKISKLMNQIYYHILCGMNSKLNKNSQVVSKIVKLLLKTKIELHEKVLLALQTGSSLEDVESGIEYAELKQLGVQTPPTAFFKLSGSMTLEQKQLLLSTTDNVELSKILGHTEPFIFFKEQDYPLLNDYMIRFDFKNVQDVVKGWLNYFSVYRTREGLILCNRVLKYQKNHPELLLKALLAIERIGIQRWNNAIENSQIQKIIAIIKTCPDIRVKNQASKTLWALSKDENDEILKELLLRELDNPNSKSYALTLIDLLGNYAYSESKVGTETAQLLRNLLQANDHDIAFQATLAISKTYDPIGLLECLKIIAGPVWKRYELDEAKDAVHASGSTLMFRQRPAAIHDNKHAIRLRILDRLVVLNANSHEFAVEIDRRFKAFKADSSCNIELKEFVDHFQRIPRTHTRYIGMPLYFPSGSAIGRGLSTRKGDTFFFESIRDLIRKGCGSTDLTLETSEVEGQTWGRIGHIFGSHQSDLFFDHEGTYFYGSNSAFLVIAADYYNNEFMRGEARMESETTFNTVWYRGVPKSQLQAIFLEKQNQVDIELLAGNDPIKSIKALLTSSIFKDQSIKELVQLRRHLQAKSCVMIKGEKVQLSLAERIHYFDSSKKPPLPLEDVENVGFKFPSEEELLEESMKRAIGRQLIQEKL